jgi:hypothetical protein
MGVHRAETTIERSADDVWAVIGDFTDQSWFPGIEQQVIEGDERTTWMQGVVPGNVERLVHHDDVARTYSYATVAVVGDPRVPVEGGGFFDTSTLIGRHRATISVTPVGDARCRVAYDVTVDDDDGIAAVISSGYAGVLAGLKARLETSSSPLGPVTTRRLEPGTYRAETTVQRSADDVWMVVRDFGELSWYPGVERCVLEGNDRTTWKHGTTLASIERLLVDDDETRTHHYVLVGFLGDPLVPHAGGGTYDSTKLIGHHSATLTVTPLSDSSSHVLYDVTVDDDDMAAQISHGYGEALANLKAQLEALGRRYGGDQSDGSVPRPAEGSEGPP